MIALAVKRQDRRQRLRDGVRKTLVFVFFVIGLGLLYTGYKAMGQSTGDRWPIIGGELPVKTNDLIMPPLWDIVTSFGKPLQAGGQTLAGLIWTSGMFTLREATAGFVAGVVIGLSIAILLLRSRLLERGLLPYVIASQTIPFVAIAPIVIIWGRKNLDFLPWDWQDWQSVSLIATYLTFFPVAVSGLRGLKSPEPEALELMDSYAASWGQTLWRLRFPASLPYLFPALRLAATASVVGAIVGEISAGVRGGLGRLILDFAGKYTTGPERLYASIIGAAVLGLFVVGVIGQTERFVLSRRGQEAV
ncbi:MAG TPA: ABC transporter permease subunit [Acidimicrobiales bacterium]|nr:ABC transporter permease subunit [Acidimicrobiales bacterium]